MIPKVRAKDRDAFNELVRLYKHSVFNTCYRFLLNKEDAEDISQDVFVEVYQSIDSFRGDSQLATWIYRITVTKCLDEIKKRNRKKRLASVTRLLRLDDIVQWVSGGVMPDTALHEEDKWNEMTIILDTLPDNQRVAFTLSKLDGFTNSEIAVIMNTSTIAVESLIYRAKKKVSVELLTILKAKEY